MTAMNSREHTDWVPLDRTYTHRIHTLMKLADRITQLAYEQESAFPPMKRAAWQPLATLRRFP